MSSYDYQKLDALSKSRYLLKLKNCGLKDCPYQLPVDSWLNNPTKWPTLEWPFCLRLSYKYTWRFHKGKDEEQEES